MSGADPTPSLRIRFRRARVRGTTQLFARSRTARFLFVAAAFPFVYLADRWRGVHPPVCWSTGMHWVRTGQDRREPAIRTATEPAVVNRRKDRRG